MIPPEGSTMDKKDDGLLPPADLQTKNNKQEAEILLILWVNTRLNTFVLRSCVCVHTHRWALICEVADSFLWSNS